MKGNYKLEAKNKNPPTISFIPIIKQIFYKKATKKKFKNNYNAK